MTPQEWDSAEGLGPLLLQIHDMLHADFGPLHWWPGDTPFEVIVGAILTQNTAWRNVEIAIGRLKTEGVLSPEGIRALADETLEAWIRPSGYYRIKTQRLKAFVRWLFEHYEGNLEVLFNEPLWPLRKKLLTVKGIGEETADSILLYAGGKPIFVIDAYTRRILKRHGLIGGHEGYADVQALFMSNLPASIPVYNQFHALLVNTGKIFCSAQTPRCNYCPLRHLTLMHRRQDQTQAVPLDL